MTGICICIGKDCTAKNTLGVPGLADKVNQAKEVEKLAAEWAQKDPNKTAEQIFMTTTWRDREGKVHERQMSISEARMQFYDLQNYLSECSMCQANVASDRFRGGVFSGFGCILHMEYPISKELEEVLWAGARRAAENAKTEPSVAFLEKIVKEKVTGDPIAKLRKTDPPSMEITEAESLTWGSFLSKKTITSDQLMEMFLDRSVAPDQALIYHHFLENTNQAMVDNEIGSLDMRDFILEMSSVYAMGADMQKIIMVHRS